MFTHFGLPYVGQLCSRFILKSSKPPLHAPTSIFLCLSQLIDITPIAMVSSKRQKHSDSNEKTSEASGWIMPKPRCPGEKSTVAINDFCQRNRLTYRYVSRSRGTVNLSFERIRGTTFLGGFSAATKKECGDAALAWFAIYHQNPINISRNC